VSEPTAQATIASERAYGLSEGPLWDPPGERILWVDINAGDVLAAALHGGTVGDVQTLAHLDQTVGAAALAADGRLLIAAARSLIAPGSVAALIDESTDSRLNDGACDPAGRFLVGSLALDDRTGQECLYRLEHDGTVTVIDDDLTLSNGLAWSPDGRVLYSVDTTPALVFARGYDVASGACGERRVLLEIGDGAPDGLCVDADGNLWIAIHGAGEVRCHAPTGERLATVTVANPYTTSVAFVGPDLDTLLITSASADERTPGGHLYTARAGARGLPATPWRPV
jgi:sugar lactone lactonase YvrE